MVNMLTNTQPAIGLLVGSSREGSLNQRLARHTQALTPHALVGIDGLNSLPHFDQDIEEPTPLAVSAMRRSVAALDALLVVTPEYNASLPGALKNAIDWLSRPYGAAALSGLPVAVLGASPSPGGAAGAAADAVRILQRAGATPVGQAVTFPRAHHALAADLAAELDADLALRITDLVDELAAAAVAGRNAA